MGIVQKIIKSRTPKTKLPVLNCIKKRFSPRVFSSEEIPNTDINTILEAARLAPSGRNHQPWFFYILRNNSQKYEKLINCVPERNYWIKSAPLIIIACYDPSEPTDGINKWATYDLGAAVMSLVLQATELGYYCRQIGSFDINKLKELLSIPDPLVPITLIPIGKIGSEEDYQKSDSEIIQKELSNNSKKNNNI